MGVKPVDPVDYYATAEIEAQLDNFYYGDDGLEDVAADLEKRHGISTPRPSPRTRSRAGICAERSGRRAWNRGGGGLSRGW
ncbi:hypothetical protein JCM9533A_83920 [Catenuloplanes niger JCM 9533]